MKTAVTVVVADGVPYEVRDTRISGENVNVFASRHLLHVAEFVEMLDGDIESLETEFSK